MNMQQQIISFTSWEGNERHFTDMEIDFLIDLCAEPLPRGQTLRSLSLVKNQPNLLRWVADKQKLPLKNFKHCKSLRDNTYFLSHDNFLSNLLQEVRSFTKLKAFLF